MAITNFTGLLTQNKIFGAIYNMIISQEVFADNIKGTYSSLVDKARVDGSMYGDTKLYYSVDVLQTHDWLNDAEAANLLALDRPQAPSVQKITIDQFRQIRLTVDNYLTKQAWSTEGAFTSFNSVMLGMIRDTKRIYDSTLYNAFIGTNETDEGEQSITITPVSGQNDALTMAEALADLLVSLKDVSRDYNDYGYMRSFEESDLHVIWNAKVYNTLKKIDMPVIFHKDGLLNEFEQSVLPARNFGTIVDPSSSADFTIPEGTDTYRILDERDVTVGGEKVHLFPGEKIPAGAKVPKNKVYKEDATIAFKLIHKRSVPYMSAFEVATSFFNPRSLTENNYLTFGYNTLEHLAQFPFITARFAE
jgi:hypothetical protein